MLRSLRHVAPTLVGAILLDVLLAAAPARGFADGVEGPSLGGPAETPVAAAAKANDKAAADKGPAKTAAPAKATAPSEKAAARAAEPSAAKPGKKPQAAKPSVATEPGGAKAAEPAAGKPQEGATAKPSGKASPDKPIAKPKPKPELNEAMQALRDRVRWTLAAYHRQMLNTQSHNATDVLHACLAYGCATEVQHGGEQVNGITALCWNYPCAGYELLTLCEGRAAARVGHGLERHSGQFLATLAFARVPANYPVRVGEYVRSVADLVQYEKQNCRAGVDQSLRLVSLAYYVKPGETWQNGRGESWSIDRLVKEELALPTAESPEDGINRLMGLSRAVDRHAADNSAASLERAKKFVREYQGYAFRLQNSDGSWHPAFFAATGAVNDQPGHLRATAYIAEWLAVSLPDERLQAEPMVRAVEYLSQSLGVQQVRWNVYSLNSQHLGSVMHALRALSAYDERVFKPCDPAEAEEAKPADATSAE